GPHIRVDQAPWALEQSASSCPFRQRGTRTAYGPGPRVAGHTRFRLGRAPALDEPSDSALHLTRGGAFARAAASLASVVCSLRSAQVSAQHYAAPRRCAMTATIGEVVRGRPTRMPARPNKHRALLITASFLLFGVMASVLTSARTGTYGPSTVVGLSRMDAR